MSNELESLQFKLERIIKIYKHAGKVGEDIFSRSYVFFRVCHFELNVLGNSFQVLAIVFFTDAVEKIKANSIVASTNTCYYSENQIFYSLE